MRVPGSSAIDRLHSDLTAEQALDRENLQSWEFSDGNSFPACEVWVEARKARDRAISIVQPINQEP
jgi:hypothetical protein